MTRIRLVALLAALWGASWLLPAPAQAQVCNASAAGVAFGRINTVRNEQYQNATAISMTCSGNQNAQIRLCPYLASGNGGASANGPRQMASGSNKLDYDLFTTASYTTRWANDQAAGANPDTVITLGGSGSATVSIPIYGRIPAGQTAVAVGSYTSLLNNNQVIYGYAASFTSCSVSGSGNRSFSFTVSANNTTTCMLATTTMSFGTATQIAANVDATAALTVTCAVNTPYSITLNGGANGGTSADTRKMANGANTITYGLYQDSNRSVGWYNDAAGTYSGTANGLAQSITVYGRVPPQTTPSSGAYSDSVIVTVTY